MQGKVDKNPGPPCFRPSCCSQIPYKHQTQLESNWHKSATLQESKKGKAWVWGQIHTDVKVGKCLHRISGTVDLRRPHRFPTPQDDLEGPRTRHIRQRSPKTWGDLGAGTGNVHLGFPWKETKDQMGHQTPQGIPPWTKDSIEKTRLDFTIMSWLHVTILTSPCHSTFRQHSNTP